MDKFQLMFEELRGVDAQDVQELASRLALDGVTTSELRHLKVASEKMTFEQFKSVFQTKKLPLLTMNKRETDFIQAGAKTLPGVTNVVQCLARMPTFPVMTTQAHCSPSVVVDQDQLNNAA